MILHIGYSKTGTTWLQKYIFSNPESGFYVPGENTKELGTNFVYGIHKPSRPNWGTDSLFKFDELQVLENLNNIVVPDGMVQIISNEILIGDINCGGVQGPIIAERIKKTIPDAKILITIREQVSLTKSIYDQYLRSGGVSSIKSYISDKDESYIPLFNKSFLDYDTISKYYENIFGMDNVLVLPIEMLAGDPDLYFSKLYSFSEIEYPKGFIKAAINQPKYNVSNNKTMTALYILRRLNFLSEPSNFNMRMGLDIINITRVSELLRHFIPRSLSTTLSKNIRLNISNFFKDYFVDSNISISKRYNLDLDKYGYRFK